MQNADFLLVLGSRLNIRQVSYFWQAFARAAFKTVVDIDAAELEKPTVTLDLPVHADARRFLDAAARGSRRRRAAPGGPGWRDWCRARRERYPVVLPEYWRAAT